MNFFETDCKASFKYVKALFKWIILALCVGLVGGAIGSIFHLTIDIVTEFRTENNWVILLLPIGGVVIALAYGLSKKYGKIDTNRVLNAVKTEDNVPLIMAPLIFVSTVITHLLGGSAGRE